MDETGPIVRCDGVTREYTRDGNRRWLRRSREPAPPVQALDDVTLTVHPGEFVGVSGPSGSGKSTLLHLMAALDTPTAGTVEIAGRDVSDLSERRRARIRLDTIGIVFQRFYLLPSLSARANVALPLVEQGLRKRDRRDRAIALLEDVGLGDRASHLPGELSGGEQQRVAVARALATDPALVIADEPTGEVDSQTGERLIALFEAVAHDRAVVVASHDTDTIAATDRVVYLRDGHLVDGV